MVETLNEKIRPKERKILYSYIDDYEETCTNETCKLKNFLKIPLKIENFNKLKKYVLIHAEVLYKNAISKYPFNSKLRLSYGLFLYNKINKKEQGTSEILLLSKYSSNFEDSFLIFRAQKLIEEENSGLSKKDRELKTITYLSYKAIINNMRSIMGKIAMNYIDFWTILSRNDEIKNNNFKRMNKIGNKINRLNEELKNNIAKLEKCSLYEIDTMKLYSKFCIEILNDHSTANIYNSKIMELEQTKHQFNEDNIFNLEFKAMSRSEEYNYIVIHCGPDNFGLISNMSLSANKIFGFIKEDILGRPLDYIFTRIIYISS